MGEEGGEMTETGRRGIGTGRLLALTGGLTVVCAVLFLVFPQIDLAVSAHYLRDDGKFLLRGSWISDFIDMYVRPGLRFALVGLILYILWRLFGPRRLRSFRPLLFIVLALGLGPGLLVNVVLKEHWGRARPVAVAEFAATRRLRRPWSSPTSATTTVPSFRGMWRSASACWHSPCSRGVAGPSGCPRRWRSVSRFRRNG